MDIGLAQPGIGLALQAPGVARFKRVCESLTKILKRNQYSISFFYNKFKGIDDSLYRMINISFLLVSLPTQIGAGRENGGLKKLTGLYLAL